MIIQDLKQICSYPIASAFIFTYNQEFFVKQTIESLLNQECDFDYEIVVCDDCSKDSTLEVCLEYQKKYPNVIRVVRNDQNLGARANFFTNILKYTRGQYVACCAGDDWWRDTKKLQKQVNFLQNNREYGLVHTHAAIYIDKDKKYSKRLLGSNKNTFQDNLLTNHVAALTICFTMQTFNEYVLEVDPINLPYSEDYPLILWYSFRSKIYFMDNVSCVYRYLTHSLSHSTNVEKIYKGPLDFFNCGIHFINIFNINDEDLIKKACLHLFLDRMRWAHLLKDKENIVKGELFFIQNKYYSFWALSKLYKFAGQNEFANKCVFYMGIIIRKLHPTHTLFS